MAVLSVQLVVGLVETAVLAAIAGGMVAAGEGMTAGLVETGEAMTVVPAAIAGDMTGVVPVETGVAMIRGRAATVVRKEPSNRG